MQKRREIEIDVQDLTKYLIRHWVTIAIVTLVAMIAGFGYQALISTPVYESQSMIYITTGANGGNMVQNMLSSLQAGNALTADYKTLATSKPVLEQVIKELNLDLTYTELKEKVSTENPDNTRILTIKVQDPDPAVAKTIVDKLTTIEQDKITDVMGQTKPSILQWGDIQTTPVSASPVHAAENCGFIALLLVLGFFIIRFIQNDVIGSAEDIEKTLDLRTLAEIPLISAEGKKHKTKRFGRTKTK